MHTHSKRCSPKVTTWSNNSCTSCVFIKYSLQCLHSLVGQFWETPGIPEAAKHSAEHHFKRHSRPKAQTLPSVCLTPLVHYSVKWTGFFCFFPSLMTPFISVPLFFFFKKQRKLHPQSYNSTITAKIYLSYLWCSDCISGFMFCVDRVKNRWIDVMWRYVLSSYTGV